jgi:hypothetical protein
MKIIAPLLVLVLAAGCKGPLTVPAVQRLSADDQAHVNHEWDNMLRPTDRLGRELLLDVVMFYQLHQDGVDRLHMQSEKDYTDGTVVMTIDFVRANDPSRDRFTIEIKDHSGRSIRKETYSGEEVLAQYNSLGNPTTRPDGRMTEDQAAAEMMVEAKLRQIAAATQPADAPATTMPSLK